MKKAYVAVLMLGLALGLSLPSMMQASPMMNRCPRIHEATHALEVAIQELDHAGHDFCGHKVEAMEAARHALEQLHQAENCDKCK